METLIPVINPNLISYLRMEDIPVVEVGILSGDAKRVTIAYYYENAPRIRELIKQFYDDAPVCIRTFERTLRDTKDQLMHLVRLAKREHIPLET